MVIFAANFICALISGKIVIYGVTEMENLEKDKVERKTQFLYEQVWENWKVFKMGRSLMQRGSEREILSSFFRLLIILVSAVMYKENN